ncbi:MAG: acyltransferase family protein, partial [Planctomycetota bacterium]
MSSKLKTSSERFDWIDWVKGISILLIIFNHISEELFGGAHYGNPNIGWPSLNERIAQLAPLPIDGLRGIVANVVRYGGWIGEQAVTVFIIMTGIGLTLSSLLHGPSIDWRTYLKSRFTRILPIWIVAHLLILLPPALLGYRVSVAHPEFYLSLPGIRLDHHQVYYGIPAWWYVSLLLQLYLIFPIVYSGFKSYGRNQALIVFVTLGFVCRFAGLMLLRENLDAWSRGTICVSRLAEFAFGIWFGFLIFNAEHATLNRLRSPRAIGIAIGSWLVGSTLGLTLWGMTFFCFVTGVAGFVLLYAMMTASLGARLFRSISPVLSW